MWMQLLLKLIGYGVTESFSQLWTSLGAFKLRPHELDDRGKTLKDLSILVEYRLKVALILRPSWQHKLVQRKNLVAEVVYRLEDLLQWLSISVTSSWPYVLIGVAKWLQFYVHLLELVEQVSSHFISLLSGVWWHISLRLNLLVRQALQCVYFVVVIRICFKLRSGLFDTFRKIRKFDSYAAMILRISWLGLLNLIMRSLSVSKRRLAGHRGGVGNNRRRLRRFLALVLVAGGWVATVRERSTTVRLLHVLD